MFPCERKGTLPAPGMWDHRVPKTYASCAMHGCDRSIELTKRSTTSHLDTNLLCRECCFTSTACVGQGVQRTLHPVMLFNFKFTSMPHWSVTVVIVDYYCHLPYHHPGYSSFIARFIGHRPPVNRSPALNYYSVRAQKRLTSESGMM